MQFTVLYSPLKLGFNDHVFEKTNLEKMNAINFCETYFFRLTSWKWPIVPQLFYTPMLLKGISSLSGLFMLLALRLVNKFEMKGGTKNWFSPLYVRPFCSFFCRSTLISGHNNFVGGHFFQEIRGPAHMMSS